MASGDNTKENPKESSPAFKGSISTPSGVSLYNNIFSRFLLLKLVLFITSKVLNNNF